VPYRSARVETPKLTAEAGIVDDMVRQFADRHAFLRELIQNGIDAGATRIDVRLERGADGTVRTSVEDDGSGMTRAIIEGPLLTLFESSKESDSTKIGKYGIGFVSVFAIEPSHIDVRTRTAGEAWLVRLFGDHSFELANDVARPGTGTEVILIHTMTTEAFAEHAARARTALVRWCRHARVPITFVALEGYEGGEETTINAELALPGLVTLSVKEGDETFVVAVGDAGAPGAAGPESAASFSGFYNRGLTLMESTAPEPALEGLRFKIDSPRLSHTMSRDNIRRDRESERLVDRVRALAKGPLWQRVLEHLARAALEATTSSSGDAYAALLATAQRRCFAGQDTSAIVVPLLEPVEGERTMSLHALIRGRRTPRGQPVLVADGSTHLTRAVTGTGRAIVRHVVLAPLLRPLVDGIGLGEAEHAFAFARAVEERGEDASLVAELARLLGAAGRTVARVRLGAFSQIANESAYRVVRTDGDTALTSPDEAMLRPWGGSATLFLNGEHATVRLARRRAKSDLAMAAQLLCRAVLVAEGPLEAAAVDRLLGAAVVTTDGGDAP
jgi:molecular chaperone HtpG